MMKAMDENTSHCTESSYEYEIMSSSDSSISCSYRYEIISTDGSSDDFEIISSHSSCSPSEATTDDKEDSHNEENQAENDCYPSIWCRSPYMVSEMTMEDASFDSFFFDLSDRRSERTNRSLKIESDSLKKIYASESSALSNENIMMCLEEIAAMTGDDLLETKNVTKKRHRISPNYGRKAPPTIGDPMEPPPPPTESFEDSMVEDADVTPRISNRKWRNLLSRKQQNKSSNPKKEHIEEKIEAPRRESDPNLLIQRRNSCQQKSRPICVSSNFAGQLMETFENHSSLSASRSRFC